MEHKSEYCTQNLARNPKDEFQQPNPILVDINTLHRERRRDYRGSWYWSKLKDYLNLDEF